MDGASPLTLVLGPTNTGKTHRAIERLLEHPTGMIGLPLRLLAREVYDRVTARIGEREVALVTGEEKRVPPRPRYWVCTVEAMPTDRDVDFVAVDEIQLVSHAERGHVFTDRLLHARGKEETWFLGADSARHLASHLLPSARVRSHPRLSKLRSFGAATLAALPPRTAVVAFSAARVYELAERLREKRGGAAVVLGALSPRARNAQVALYQSGEVDYLVATDAIGMGLNLDVRSVAFADVHKFDGKESRVLEPAELAQIAGRAGRYLNDGTFGTLAPLPSFSDATTRAIEQHHFPQQELAYYRNSDLDTSSVAALLESLARPSRDRRLRRIDRADDTSALHALVNDADVCSRVRAPGDVALLWTVCQIPNFRGLWVEEHVTLLTDVFLALTGPRAILDADWMASRVARLDEVRGDIETLLARMAGIRSFTYVSHHPRWVEGAEEWQERTRAIEDRLSDALHERLVARFVEHGGARRRGQSRARPRRAPSADDADEAPLDGNPFARLLALRRIMTQGKHEGPLAPDEDDVGEWLDAPHARFRLDEGGRIGDGERVLARLVRGPDLLRPDVTVQVSELGTGARSRLARRLVAWTRDVVGMLLEPLRHPSVRELSPAARGLAYQAEQGLGTLPVANASEQVRSLTDDDRAAFAELGLRVGRLVVHVPRGLEADALTERAALVRTFHGSLPRKPPGVPSYYVEGSFDRSVHGALGFPVFGSLAVRADVVERVVQRLDANESSAPFELPPEVPEWLGRTPKEAASVVRAFGYRSTESGGFVRARRPRRRTRR